MKVTNEISTYDDEHVAHKCEIKSHWNNKNLVKLTLWNGNEGLTVTVNGSDLHKAIDNATNI